MTDLSLINKIFDQKLLKTRFYLLITFLTLKYKFEILKVSKTEKIHKKFNFSKITSTLDNFLDIKKINLRADFFGNFVTDLSLINPKFLAQLL